MKSLAPIIPLLAALAFAILAVTGIDLIMGRVGLGMVALGGALFLFCLLILAKPPTGRRFGLAALVLAGGAYFIWRAQAGGPMALAHADIALVLAGLGVYLGVVACGEKGRRIWIALVAVVALLNAAIALYQQWSPGIYYFWQSRDGDHQMVAGFFGHYNAFAAYLNGSVFFLLSYVVLGKRMGLRVLFALGSIAIVAAVVFSGSRGGWLSFVVGGAVWLVFLSIDLKRHGSRLFGPVALAGVLLVVAGGVTSIGVVRKLTAERQLEQNPDLEPEANLAEADGGRMAFQQMAFEVFQDEPMLGAGPQAFSYRSLEKWDRDALGIWTNLPVYAHNEYLQVLSDYGLVGFLVVVVLLFGHGVVGLAGVLFGGMRDREMTIWQIGAAGGLAAILAQSFFSFLFHFPACLALAAVQLAMLASPASRPRKSETALGRVVALGGLAVAVGLIVAGWPLGQSYRLQRQGMKELAAARGRDEVFQGFATLTEAGNLAKQPDIFEVIARRAMTLANQAEKEGHAGLAREYNLKAKDALERALELNPHFGEGLAGLPRVNDKLGNFTEAEEGHRKAMAELWTREISLRPHYQAARSSYFKAFRAGSNDEALKFLYQARERLQRRLDILRRKRDLQPMRDFSAEVEAWIAFHEGRRLFQKGDDIWKNARPRNPELAMALLLEAQKRYEKSKEVVAEKEPLWIAEWKQLETHLGYLKAGRTNPAPLDEEELRNYLLPDVGLATGDGSR